MKKIHVHYNFRNEWILYYWKKYACCICQILNSDENCFKICVLRRFINSTCKYILTRAIVYRSTLTQNLRLFTKYCILEIYANRVPKHPYLEEHNSCFVEYTIYNIPTEEQNRSQGILSENLPLLIVDSSWNKNWAQFCCTEIKGFMKRYTDLKMIVSPS